MSSVTDYKFYQKTGLAFPPHQLDIVKARERD